MTTSDSSELMVDAIASLLSALLPALEGFARVQRRLHPPDIGRLARSLAPVGPPLDKALDEASAIEWPEHTVTDVGRLVAATKLARETVQGMATLAPGNEIFSAYGVLRRSVRCHRLIYPLAGELPPISRFYLEESVRSSPRYVDRLATREPEAKQRVGLFDLDNDPGKRGGASIYVPEFYDADREWPLVVALHGGSGHGADFLWSWLREARTRGALLLSPTSRGGTWSLEQPRFDGEALAEKVEWIGERFNLDRSRILLTGISDGATFALQYGLLSEAPFTHLAPLSGVLGPLSHEQRATGEGKPIYLVHGALDWMFPVEVARMAHQELASLGAKVRYREIENLSHTYAREENVPILEWLDPSLELDP